MAGIRPSFNIASVAAAVVLLAALCCPVTARAAEGSFTVVSDLVAETRAVMEKDSDGVIVVTVYIDRIKDGETGVTQAIPGGIGSYSATVTAGANTEILGVRGGDVPYDNPAFDSGTGVFHVDSIASPEQPDQTPVAKLVVRLTGDCLTACSIEVSFQEIIAADDPGLNVPEESSHTLLFQRAHVNSDSVVNIVDAMIIAQYTVGLRTISQFNALNAASTWHDTGGDKINIVDAMAIAQYTVRIRDENFEIP